VGGLCLSGDYAAILWSETGEAVESVDMRSILASSVEVCKCEI